MSCIFTRSEQAVPQAAATMNDMKRQVKVELNVFSGRENPTWLLSTQQADAFVSALDELPISDPKSFPDGLGYRGFRVTLTDTALEEAITVTVYKGTVRRDDKSGAKYLTDKDSRVEKLLLESGISRLDPNLYEVVQKEIAPPKE
jgi:hypothetical protein